MSLRKEKRNTFNIPSALHYKVDVEAAQRQKPIYKVLEEAWELYERQKIDASPPPLAAETRLIAKFLRFWREPDGMEIPLRKYIASVLEEEEPPLPEKKV